MSEYAAPKWSRELARFLPSKSQFVLWGNIHDVYPAQVQGGVTPLRMDAFLNVMLMQQGYSLVVKYEPLVGFSIMEGSDVGAFQRLTGLACAVGSYAQVSLSDAARNIEKLVKAQGVHCAVLMDFASRIEELCGSANEVNAFFYRMVRLAGESAPKMGVPVPGSAPASLYSPLIWVLEREDDLPAWYGAGDTRLRSVLVPKPDAEARRSVAEAVAPGVVGFMEMGEEQRKAALQLFVEQTEGLFASDLTAIAQIAQRAGLRFGDIDEAIRRCKLGTSEDLWARLDRARLSQAEEALTNKVIGQEQAVRRALRILKRSLYGLSGSQFSRYRKRPRGVLFFAGPAGVGKSELASALSELAFGSSANCVRFDMGEFSQEDSARRLVDETARGGGKLISAVKREPFSIILLENIEKAHPKVLDKLMQILDEGRLSSGRGETVYFSECLIVFTSTLGVFVQEPDGTMHQNVNPGMPYDEVADKVSSALDDFFRYKVNRPEFINRFGKNIIVFDFVRDEASERIFDKMLSNIRFRLKETHGVALAITEDARRQLLDEIRRDLSSGGRGVGNTLEEMLIDPLAQILFDNPLAIGGEVTVNNIEKENGEWQIKADVL